MRFSIACIALSLVSVACDSETTNCNNAGCESGLHIELHDTPEHATHYYVRISYDFAPNENVFECSFDLPGSAPDADGDGGLPNRYGDPLGETGCSQTEGKSPVELRFLPDKTDPQFFLLATPEAARVRIVRAGQPRGAGAFGPKYEKLDPNGPHCGPHCSVATHHIDLVTGMAKNIPLPKGGI